MLFMAKSNYCLGHEECENDSPLRGIIQTINFSTFNDYRFIERPAYFTIRSRNAS